jgi:mRNA interferase MazF
MVDSREYTPRRGDIIWINLDPRAGHEQAGRRPAVVLSHEKYNGKTGLALICPITSRLKGYPFEVLISEGLPVKGAILSDQVKSLDWRIRKVELIGVLSEEIISEVLQKLGTLLSI